MKFFKSVPETEEHRSFFSDYARFAKGIAWLIVVSQIISGLTESVMFYATGYDAFIQFGHKVAVFFGVCTAFIGVGLIEWFGLRFMLPQCTRQFLYRRFKGMHLAMTIFIVIVTSILIGASYFLSLGGSDHTVTAQIEKAKSRETDKIQLGHGESLGLAGNTYTIDSTEVETRYSALIASVNQRYNGEKEVAQNNLVTWASKRGNYQTRINKARTALKKVEADRGRELADLEQKKALEHQALRGSYKKAKDSLQAILTATLTTSSNDFEATEDKFAMASFWVVLVAITVSIICIILRSIYHKGSGQQELPVPTDYDFRPSLLSEALGAWTERLQTRARNAIVSFESKTPQAELSKRVNTVYDRNALRELVIKLELEQLDDASKIIQIAAPVIEKPTRKIGFRNTSSSDSNESVNNASVKKGCLNCGTDISHRRSDAKYCKDTCRLEYHAKQHGGTKFNPKLKKGK